LWELWAKAMVIGFLGFGFVGAWFPLVWLPLALRLLSVPVFVLVATLIGLSRTFAKLSYALRKQYLYDSWASRQITKMAITLCRDEVLKRLGLFESNIVFVSMAEHLAKLKSPVH